MLVGILPLIPSVANYRVSTTLSDTKYTLDFHWNAREEFWYMDVLAADLSPIVQGLKLVLGSSPGIACADSRYPPGMFFVKDLSNQGIEATFDDMGDRVIVYYFA